MSKSIFNEFSFTPTTVFMWKRIICFAYQRRDKKLIWMTQGQEGKCTCFYFAFPKKNIHFHIIDG